MPSGSVFSQPRRVPSSGSTAVSKWARFSHQWVADFCLSASRRAVALPSTAKYAARLVDTVDLPAPPLELATRIVRMRGSATKDASL